MKKISLLFLSLLLVFTLESCVNQKNNNQKIELTISAAASLQNALTEIQENYLQVKPNVKLTMNFGGSGTLEQQIEQGAPADLFISAGTSQMDALEQKNLLVNDTRIDLLGNDLVLIVGKDNTSVASVQDILNSEVSNVSIGTPESVPAGKYAKESLTNLDLWEAIQPKLILAKDVTQVLSYVEIGDVDAGFVYQSDANSSNKVKIVAVLPESSHQPIVYPAAVIADSKNIQDAKDFLAYLQDTQAQQIFEKYGFKTNNIGD